MREQIEFSLSKMFQAFMTGLGDLGEAQSVIHGVFIDIHPVWKIMVDYRRITGIDYGFFGGVLRGFYPSGLGTSLPSCGPYDLGDTPHAWHEMCIQLKKETKTPFIVKVYVVPTTSDTLPLRRRVENYSREQPFFTSVIDEPMAVLAASVQGGVDISAAGSGTLGGFLKDQNGTPWGVTCGHVAQSVGSNVALGVGGAQLGKIGYSNFAQLSPQTQAAMCNQYVNPGHLAVDGALIELSKQHTAIGSVQSVGRIDKIFDRTQLGAGNTVSMTGASSGTHDYDIGGYGVTTKARLSSGSGYYCFSHVFDFYAPGNAWRWIPGRLACAAAARPLQGDSGAWLCFNYSGNSYAYFGNIIAVRGASGIATFADSLVTWANDNCGLQLDPL